MPTNSAARRSDVGNIIGQTSGPRMLITGKGPERFVSERRVVMPQILAGTIPVGPRFMYPGAALEAPHATGGYFLEFGSSPMHLDVEQCGSVQPFPLGERWIEDRPFFPSTVAVHPLQSAAHAPQPHSAPQSLAAMSAAYEIMLKTIALNFSPARLVPNNDDGLSFYFFGANVLPGGAHELYATVECTSSGEVIATWGNRTTGFCDVDEVTDAEFTLMSLRQYLGRDHI